VTESRNRRRPARGAFEVDPFEDATPARSGAAEPEQAGESATPAEVVPAAANGAVAAPAPKDPGELLAWLAGEVPDPYSGDGSALTLSAEEELHLERCETAIAASTIFFALKGKALQTIRDARLYKQTHSTFDLYCLDRWDLTARRVNQLIEGWELGMRLGTMVPKIVNERQVRALQPYASRHGIDAATQVYQAIADVARPTGALVERVVAALPEARHDPEIVARLVRDAIALEGARTLPARNDRKAPDVFEVETTRLRRASQQMLAVARERPQEAREFAGALRTLADEVERTVEPEPDS
jgi:hypothetical protein